MNLDQLDLFAEAVDREPLDPAAANRTVFAVLDLETTGLSPRDDKIIEVGALRFDWGSSLDTLYAADRLDALVNPGMPVPRDVTSLTGIADADVANAPPIEQVAPRISEFLASATCFVAHKASFETSFLAAAGIDTGHMQVLDTRDLVVMCQPSLITTSLPRVAPSLNLPGGGHRAFADALQTAQMLTLFLSRDYLGGLSDNVLLTILGHTPETWIPRLLFMEEAFDRGIAGVPAPGRLCAVDFEPRPEGANVAAQPAVTAPDAKCGEAVAAALDAGQAQVLPVVPDPAATQGLAEGILTWAGQDDRRVLVAVPALAGTGVVGSLWNAIETAGTGPAVACLIEPERYVDLRRLETWLAGRVLDNRPEPKDFGESRMLVKLLSWMTHMARVGRRQLRFLNQHDMPMLALDRGVHWPALKGAAESESGSLAPSGLSHLPDHSRDPDDANVVVADHATVIHTALNDPEFAGDFDAIVVEDLWHLARMDAERDQETHTLGELSHLVDRVQEAFGPDAVPPTAAWLPDRTDLAACLRTLDDLRRTSANTLARLVQVVAATASELRELDGKRDKRWPSDQSLDSCRTATAWGELVKEGQTLMADLSGVTAALDNLQGLLGDAADSDSRISGLCSQAGLLSEQIARLGDFLEVFLARTPTAAAPNAVYWVTARNANAGDDATALLERLGFSRTMLLPPQFLTEELETQTDSLVLTARTTASWEFGDFVTDRLDIGNLPVAVPPSPPRRATLLVGPTGLDAAKINRILAELLARLYPPTGRFLTQGCTIVVPPPAHTDDPESDPFQGISQDLVRVVAGNMAPLAVRQELLQPGPHLLTGSVRDLASLDLEGVDVRLVVITRLPFLPFSHPVQEQLARKMGSGYSGFMDYTLPESIAAVQRLVDLTQHASGGKAAAVLLDPRVAEKRYGSDFMDKVAAHRTSSPPASHVVSAVLDWLQG